jgi:ATP-binding cassette subfamily F protein 3
VVVSHDRHLLRATTDQFIIVADGKLLPFDGDLDDYKDWLYKTKLEQAANASLPKKVNEELPKAQPVARDAQGDDKERKRKDAETRQQNAAQRKPIETKIKRLEEQMAKGNLKKDELTQKLADSEIYNDANKEKLKTLLLDQANLTKELEQLEIDWLEQQEFLEALS